MAAAAQALQRGRAEPGTAEIGWQLRPDLAGSGMLASDQLASALDGGLVQLLDNQHHHALLMRRPLSDCATATATARPARPGLQMRPPSGT